MGFLLDCVFLLLLFCCGLGLVWGFFFGFGGFLLGWYLSPLLLLLGFSLWCFVLLFVCLECCFSLALIWIKT